MFDDRRWNKAGFDIYGNLYDDQPYLEFHVSKLIEDVYGIKPRSYVHPRSATLILRTHSRNVLRVKEDVGLHPGMKACLSLPPFLQAYESGEAIVPFLRGLVDIEGSLRFRKQFRDCHYYPVLECEMSDPPFIKTLYAKLMKLGMPVALRMRHNPTGEYERRPKGSFYLSGWKGINAWLDRFGLANPKHLSKLLIAEKYGFCPPQTSLDERLAIIAGEIDPRSFYEGRLGDLIAVPRYRYAHEVMVMRIACQPQTLPSLVYRMKVRAKLTKSAVAKLVTLKALRVRRNGLGTAVETTEQGVERLRILFKAWKELKSRFGITIPDSSSYCPSAFRSKNVN